MSVRFTVRQAVVELDIILCQVYPTTLKLLERSNVPHICVTRHGVKLKVFLFESI